MGNDRVLAITWSVTPRQPGRGVRGGSGLGVIQIMTQIKAAFEWIWVSQLWGEQGQSKIKGGRRSKDKALQQEFTVALLNQKTNLDFPHLPQSQIIGKEDWNAIFPQYRFQHAPAMAALYPTTPHSQPYVDAPSAKKKSLSQAFLSVHLPFNVFTWPPRGIPILGVFLTPEFPPQLRLYLSQQSSALAGSHSVLVSSCRKERNRDNWYSRKERVGWERTRKRKTKMEGWEWQRDEGLRSLGEGKEEGVPVVFKVLLVFAFITHTTVDSAHCLPPMD